MGTGTTHRGTLRWQAARVLAVRDETPRARTLRLALPAPRRHVAGQHYVVRLTAPDGYTASRSYSVASAPDDSGEIELTVEALEDGEVSGYLHEVVEPGDELEVRGPIGGFFAWPGDTPALLVGGGSGVVPLVSMLRQARREGRLDDRAVQVLRHAHEDGLQPLPRQHLLQRRGERHPVRHSAGLLRIDVAAADQLGLGQRRQHPGVLAADHADADDRAAQRLHAHASTVSSRRGVVTSSLSTTASETPNTSRRRGTIRSRTWL